MITPRRASRTAWFVLGGLLALGLVLFAWLHVVAYRSLQKQLTENVAEAQARSARRPVVRGEAAPGDAWPEYELGLASVGSVGFDEVRRWLDGAAEDRARAVATLAANEKALAFLRAGARKAQGAYQIQWDRGWFADMPSLVAVTNLTTLAVGQARMLVEAGKSREAAELLLDAAQFGADLGRNVSVQTEMMALSSLGQVFDALRSLPPDPEVGRALAVLDATFPNHAEALLNEMTLMGVTYMNFSVEPPAAASAWRFGFSSQLMMIDAWTTVQHTVRRMAATTTAPWAEAQRVAAEIGAEAKRSHSEIFKSMIQGLGETERVSRERRAQLRILRMLHGGSDRLDDPFGSKLLSDGARIWSVGADGVDSGGGGAWKPALTGDIVLERPVK
ncbi:MAG TPA: hypothetical protein VFV95_21175 [Vicinamibacterales bacterium]|nr:hypothetical protein [Vicinamibacterales bacterium]